MDNEGNDKKNCQGHWYSAFPSIIPSTCIHSNILNTFILKPLIQSLIFTSQWFQSHVIQGIACSCQQMSSTVPKFSVSPSIFTSDFSGVQRGRRVDDLCDVPLVFTKKWSQNYMLFRDGQRILGVISTMSVHLFQMNVSFQPLSKALGIKAPHFRLTQRERHHRYPSRKIPRMRMLLSPKYGKRSRLPSNNRAATLRDKPSWCPTRYC